jgi:hypothetical protein
MTSLPRLFLVALLLFAMTGNTLAATDKSPVVLFDEAHGEQFLPRQEGPLALTELANIFATQGFTIRSGKEPLTPASLAEVDAVVISGPFAPFAAAEIDALYAFVARGGRLTIMLHVAPVVSQLLARFDVLHSNGVIREAAPVQIAGEALNFQVTRLEKEALFAGIDDFAVYGCWALASAGEFARIAARSGDSSWIDLNKDRNYTEEDAMQSFGIVALGEVGEGNFVIFGDDAIFQNRFLSGANRQLAANLVQRLKP